MSNSYHEQTDNSRIIKTRELLQELPPFLSEYFRGIAEITSANTRYVYALDLKLFFTYLIENVKKFRYNTMNNFTLEDLSKVNVDDIEGFIEYLTFYTKVNKHGKVQEYKNNATGKGRKLAAIKSLFKYFYKKEKLKYNPSQLVDMPRLRDKNITRLEKDEVSRLISEIENGSNLTKTQKEFHGHTKDRDLAIIMLLLGTGLRVSECVGINLQDIDFNVSGIKITRKGGNQVIIYFGEEVKEVLLNYIELRKTIVPKEGHENALFLSLQNKRLSVRAIQNLVKKYSTIVNGFKNISPHKLRSTYGTNLYRKTRDIYLVADVLGHKDVNTTKRYYAQMDDERRKSAASLLKIRED